MKQTNAYIIGYSIVLVVVVAVVLSLVTLSLGPRQHSNMQAEKMSDILGSVGLYDAEAADKAKDKNQYIINTYKKYIKESFLVDSKGNKIPDSEQAAFDALGNLKAEFAKPEAERRLPVFVSRNDAGQVNYILPVYGTGLWGPIWGYLALQKNLDTIDGAVFGHKSETPGLGAEIATPAFQKQFVGKTLFGNGSFVGINVTKGVGSSAGNSHAVDAISGGTITSRAVQSMIKDCIGDYEPFLVKNGVK